MAQLASGRPEFPSKTTHYATSRHSQIHGRSRGRWNDIHHDRTRQATLRRAIFTGSHVCERQAGLDTMGIASHNSTVTIRMARNTLTLLPSRMLFPSSTPHATLLTALSASAPYSYLPLVSGNLEGLSYSATQQSKMPSLSCVVHP